MKENFKCNLNRNKKKCPNKISDNWVLIISLMPKLIQDRITDFLICNNCSIFFPPLTICHIHNNFHDKFHNYQVDMLLLIHTTVCLINIKSTELINVILSSDIYNLSYFCLRLLTSIYLKQSSHLNYSQLIRAFVSSNLFVCSILASIVGNRTNHWRSIDWSLKKSFFVESCIQLYNYFKVS